MAKPADANTGLSAHEGNFEMIEYFKDSRPGSSAIINFKSDPALVGRKLEPAEHLELGHVIEGCLLDGAGANHGEHFDDNYFVVENVSSVNPLILKWVKGGYLYDIEESTGKKRLTAKGEPNKTNMAFFRQVDQCLENKGKIPVAAEKMTPIFKAVSSALKIKITGSATLKDYIRSGRTQVPLYGEKRKALPDLINVFDDQKIVLMFDFKYIASTQKAKQDLRFKWWMQAEHYQAVARECYPGHYVFPMIFIAMSKSETDLYMARKMTVEENSLQDAKDSYDYWFSRFCRWDDAGRHVRGYFEPVEVKPFVD